MTRSGPIAKGSSATSMATAGDMAGSGAAGEEELGLKGAGLDTVRSSSPWAALLLAAGSTYQVSISSFIATPHFERKRRTHVPRAAAPSPHWLGFKLAAVLPAAPAKKKGKAKKKRDTPCALCGAAETPLWRTWPTDRRVALCNKCGIQVRTLPPGAALPELVYLPHPATATAATTTAGSELEQPVAPVQEIQPVKDLPGAALLPKQVRVNLPAPAMAATRVVPELEQPPPQEIQESGSESPPDSPILESMLDADIYLVKRTSPRRREKSPSPLPPLLTAEPERAAAAPVPGNENGKQPETWCLHCGATSTTQWRLGPAGERTLCNPCGVRYMRGGLVPEYRPKESPSFDDSVHSNMSRAVLQMRRNQVHPSPPAAYQRVRARRKRRRNGMGQQQQQPAGAQVGKKRKKQNQPAAVAELPVREKSKRIKAKEQRRQPPQPAAATQLRAGNDMLLNLNLNLNLPPPPPPALPNAGDDMEVDRHRLPALPPELPQHAAGNMEMEEQGLPPPPLALLHAGGEPMPPPDPFLFDGPSAPMIIDDDDDEPVEVIVIDDD